LAILLTAVLVALPGATAGAAPAASTNSEGAKLALLPAQRDDASAAAFATIHDTVSHGFFDAVRLFRPPGEARQFVLLLSGSAPPDAADGVLARALTAQGAMVALIDTATFQARIAADGGDCAYAAGAFENLSRYLQAEARLKVYLRPTLIGRGTGAALAYGVLAQSLPGTFAAALSIGFCPVLPVRQPMCAAQALPPSMPASVPPLSQAASAASVASAPLLRGPAPVTPQAMGPGGSPAAAGRSLLAAAHHLPAPWVVLAPATSAAAGSEARGVPPGACEARTAQAFVGAVQGAVWQALPAGTDPVAAAGRAFAQLAAQNPPPAAAPADLADLPLVEVPASGAGGAAEGVRRRFAVMLSGDGGWATIDKGVASGLAARGMPVVGLDSLRYFWSARTPRGLAADLDRIIEHYAAHWGRPEVVLVGFSQGADVLPFAVNQQDGVSRARVRLVALLSLAGKASFEFHVTQWLGPSGDLPVAPQVQRLDPHELLCVYGKVDPETICPQLAASGVPTVMLPGSHHFDGDYDHLARIVFERASSR
jgi:type IV secretory pathway VirJ component